MTEYSFDGLVEAMYDQFGAIGREVARAALAYIVSCAPVEAGPELQDAPAYHLQANGFISNGHSWSAWSPDAEAIAHRVNNWDALRAQLTAALVERDQWRWEMTRNVAHEFVATAKERDAALTERDSWKELAAAETQRKAAALARLAKVEALCAEHPSGVGIWRLREVLK